MLRRELFSRRIQRKQVPKNSDLDRPRRIKKRISRCNRWEQRLNQEKRTRWTKSPKLTHCTKTYCDTSPKHCHASQQHLLHVRTDRVLQVYEISRHFLSYPRAWSVKIHLINIILIPAKKRVCFDPARRLTSPENNQSHIIFSQEISHQHELMLHRVAVKNNNKRLPMLPFDIGWKQNSSPGGVGRERYQIYPHRAPETLSLTEKFPLAFAI